MRFRASIEFDSRNTRRQPLLQVSARPFQMLHISAVRASILPRNKANPNTQFPKESWSTPPHPVVVPSSLLAPSTFNFIHPSFGGRQPTWISLLVVSVNLRIFVLSSKSLAAIMILQYRLATSLTFLLKTQVLCLNQILLIASLKFLRAWITVSSAKLQQSHIALEISL